MVVNGVAVLPAVDGTDAFVDTVNPHIVLKQSVEADIAETAFVVYGFQMLHMVVPEQKIRPGRTDAGVETAVESAGDTAGVGKDCFHGQLSFIGNRVIALLIQTVRADTEVSNRVRKSAVFCGQTPSGFYKFGIDFRHTVNRVFNGKFTGWDKPENVFLLGKKDRDSILQSLDEADIFFFPSHGEGFSIALLEAMARALPCIATDVGANEEMLENKGGIIVPVKDIEAMTAAFELVNTPRQRESMSLWNVEKVRNNYTSSAVFKDIVESYM